MFFHVVGTNTLPRLKKYGLGERPGWEIITRLLLMPAVMSGQRPGPGIPTDADRGSKHVICSHSELCGLIQYYLDGTSVERVHHSCNIWAGFEEDRV